MTVADRRIAPRRQPRQRRAHETRERVIEAAARVFARHGYSAGTTNRIADEASLSVGSLYQYFPNKDAILVELVRRHATAGVAALQDRLADTGGLPDGLQNRIALLVDVLLDIHVGQPRLHQVLFEEAPRPPQLLVELHDLETWAVNFAEQVLRGDPEVRVDNYAMAARLVVTAAESLVHRCIASQVDGLDVKAFRAELIAMLLRYLRGDAGD